MLIKKLKVMLKVNSEITVTRDPISLFFFIIFTSSAKRERIRLERKINRISSKKEIQWSDVFFVDKYYFPNLLIKKISIEKILKLNLLELITVSEIKRQIFWDNELQKVFLLLDFIITKSKEDRILKSVCSQLDPVLRLIKEKEGFKGADSLKDLITLNLTKRLPGPVLNN